MAHATAVLLMVGKAGSKAAQAQHQQGGQSVRDAIEGAVRTIYTDWRLPISALGIVIGSIMIGLALIIAAAIQG